MDKKRKPPPGGPGIKRVRYGLSVFELLRHMCNILRAVSYIVLSHWCSYYIICISIEGWVHNLLCNISDDYF